MGAGKEGPSRREVLMGVAAGLASRVAHLQPGLAEVVVAAGSAARGVVKTTWRMAPLPSEGGAAMAFGPGRVPAWVEAAHTVIPAPGSRASFGVFGRVGENNTTLACEEAPPIRLGGWNLGGSRLATPLSLGSV